MEVRPDRKMLPSPVSIVFFYSQFSISRGSSLVERSPEKAGVGSPILPPGTIQNSGKR